MYKQYINKDNWSKIYSTLKAIATLRVDDEARTERFLNGVFYIMRTGSQWRELPSCYGKWRSVHKRYESWCRKGVFSQVLSYLAKDYDAQSILIDSTTVRAHPCAAGYKKDSQTTQCLGRSRGGFTTKIHAVVDALGYALKLTLTPGHRNDITQAVELTSGFSNTEVIADKGYDSSAFIAQLESQNCTSVIPSRANRKVPRDYDEHTYKERHLIECFFNKIKHFRRVFSRFDKKASSFLGFVSYAASLIWLK
jgi:transposase